MKIFSCKIYFHVVIRSLPLHGAKNIFKELNILVVCLLVDTFFKEEIKEMRQPYVPLSFLDGFYGSIVRRH